MNLFYVSGSTCHGEDAGLFVTAKTARQAQELATAYYEAEGWDTEPETVRVHPVPRTASQPCVHEWTVAA